jgi:hypothetical protein
MRSYQPSSLSFFGSLALATTLLGGCVAEEAPLAAEEFDAKPKRMAPDQQSAAENAKLWNDYCVGEAGAKVAPNYDNSEVMDAARKLSKVWRHSFSLYSDIGAHHRTPVPANLTSTVKKDAHDFLGYLCGEFRDRATMVQAKVRWVAGMNYLDNKNSGAWDPKGNPWKQMKQAHYQPYLDISAAVFAAKENALSEEGRRTMQVGSLTVDTPVPPFTVCETKYIFAEYVTQDRAFDDYATYTAGYATFDDDHCTKDDRDYYYDFRGDSNIKPNSPESNGMIWFSRTIARQCDARPSATPYEQARPESSVPADVCKAYYKYPFNSRWNAARAGLASWVLVDPNAGGLDSNSNFTVVPHSVENEQYLFGDVAPYRATNAGGAVPLLETWNKHWRKNTFGLTEHHANSKETIHRLLQLAVDRHTDWYNSGYDDQMAYKPYARDQAYSPFVASSYEMSKSDGFVTPGTTVPVIDPSSRNYKHFMFVFRVHKDNWYTPERINKQSKPAPNFDRMWFDETSFGETGLANSERAWDRMGTTLEAEHDSILYLHNIASF